jgi:hypothetical protein
MNTASKWMLGALAVGLFSPQAKAIDLLSTNGTGPVGNCMPALPQYDAQTRKRPLSFINEGVGNVYVTCAFTTEEVSINVNSFTTRVTNISDAPATVSCTAVIGDELEDASYIAKSITLPAGTDGDLSWGTADNGGLLFSKSVAISCALPPWTGLNRNRITTVLSIL